MRKTTDWKQVSLIITAGVIAAAQIGKAAIATPPLRDELGLSLLVVSWVIGAYAALGAFGGLATGLLVSRFQIHRTIVAALALIAAGNLLGALAQGATLLIASRVVEGIGFLGLVIAAPTLLRSVVAQRHQDVVFACWSAYIPLGAAIMMLAGPWLLQFGWQTLWFVNAAVAAAHAALMLALPPPAATMPPASTTPALADLADLLKSRTPLLLAGIFGLYSLQYYALATFLPILLVERIGLDLNTAGTVSGFAVLTNAVGNVTAGFILKFGVPLWAMASVVFLAIGVSGFAIFGPGLPVAVVGTAAALSFCITALVPASVIASAPRLTDTARQLALTIGIIQQASSIGQFVGPVILALWVEHTGWPGARYLYLIIAILGLAIVAQLRRTRPRA